MWLSLLVCPSPSPSVSSVGAQELGLSNRRLSSALIPDAGPRGGEDEFIVIRDTGWLVLRCKRLDAAALLGRNGLDESLQPDDRNGARADVAHAATYSRAHAFYRGASADERPCSDLRRPAAGP